MKAWRAAAAMVPFAAAQKTATAVDSTAAPLPAATAIPWRAAVRAASAVPPRHEPTICRAVAARTVGKATARAVVIAGGYSSGSRSYSGSSSFSGGSHGYSGSSGGFSGGGFHGGGGFSGGGGGGFHGGWRWRRTSLIEDFHSAVQKNNSSRLYAGCCCF